jgi:hypothetical protein
LSSGLSEGGKMKFEGIILTRDQIRTDVDPNYHVYVMVESQKLTLGEIPEEWDCKLFPDIHIVEIQEAKNPPSLVKKFKDAFNIVGLVTWNLYLLPTYSKLKKKEVEQKITSVLEDEKYKVSVFVYSAPMVLKREIIKIPLTLNDIEKIGQKHSVLEGK